MFYFTKHAFTYMTSFPHISCSVEDATLNQCWNFNKEVAKNSENKGQNAY